MSSGPDHFPLPGAVPAPGVETGQGEPLRTVNEIADLIALAGVTPLGERNVGGATFRTLVIGIVKQMKLERGTELETIETKEGPSGKRVRYRLNDQQEIAERVIQNWRKNMPKSQFAPDVPTLWVAEAKKLLRSNTFTSAFR